MAGFDEAQRRVEDRLPGIEHVCKDASGKKCLVSINYLKPAPRNFISAVIPTMEVNIYDSELNLTQLPGSYIVLGGRGGCMTLGEDRPDFFEMIQLSTAAPPCFANPNRLGSTGILRVSVQGTQTLFEVLTLDKVLQAQCAVEAVDLLKK